MSSSVLKSSRNRKCRHCKQLFRPDCRNRNTQRYCGETICRQASKRASQQRWLCKAENHDYFRGEQNTARNRAWRAANPGYSREQNKGASSRRASGALESGTQKDHCASQSTENQQDTEILVSRTQQDHSSLQLSHFVGLISILTGEAQQDPIEQISARLHRRGLPDSRLLASRSTTATTDQR